MRAQYVFFSLLLLAHASIAHGQLLVAGDTIRVKASQSTEAERGWTEATVDRLTPDTLWYRSRGSVSPMSMDNADIQRYTFRDYRWGGAQLGGLAGGAIGGLVGHLRFEPELVEFRKTCTSLVPSLCDEFRQTNSGLLASIKGAAAGALVGGMVGWFVGRTAGRWETVDIDQITTGDGTLSLSLRIRR